MDWRSSFKRFVLLLGASACAIAITTSCGRNAVRASEKEFLADRIMIFDEDPQETAADEHVMNNREGSAGGKGTAGGGCGCN